MTEEEFMAIHRQWQHAIAEALSPLLSQGAEGLQVMRVFYVVNIDGKASAGQIGITPEGRQREAHNLVRSIITILSDRDDNWNVEAVEVPGKS